MADSITPPPSTQQDPNSQEIKPRTGDRAFDPTPPAPQSGPAPDSGDVTADTVKPRPGDRSFKG
jgi:hypothetical protein